MCRERKIRIMISSHNHLLTSSSRFQHPRCSAWRDKIHGRDDGTIERHGQSRAALKAADRSSSSSSMINNQSSAEIRTMRLFFIDPAAAGVHFAAARIHDRSRCNDSRTNPTASPPFLLLHPPSLPPSPPIGDWQPFH